MQKMKAAIYKLGEYKIIESDTRELRWEAHFGLGEHQEGKCFKKGTILFIGPAEDTRSGFLKGEFLDHLKRYPQWLKTKYYCRGLEVYHCETGKRVTKEEMSLWIFDRGINEGGEVFSEKPEQGLNNISIRRAIGEAAFRIQRYEIVKKKNGEVVWKTYAGPNTLSSGTCIILEDILFIGSWQNRQSKSIKGLFLANFQQLPRWDETKYYCSNLSLHDCRTGNCVHFGRKRSQDERTAAETDHARKRYNKSTESKSKNTDRSNKHAITLSRWMRKCIIYFAALILLIISSFFAYMIRYWKELKERWHFKKGKHSSGHHRDH
jgi:hypothetical protein